MRRSADKHCCLFRATFAGFVLLLSFSGQISGQSGRRGAKPTPTPISAENNSSKAVTRDDANTLTKLAGGSQLNTPVTLLVARQPTSKHLPSEDVITAGFVKRLNEFRDITATSLGDLKRADAVKRAKAEPAAFIVVLQFDIDSFQDGTIILNSQCLEVKYLVFAPRTGKQLAKGKVYYQPVGGGVRKASWPVGTPIKITSEAAGIEVAEQLYYSLVLLVGVKQTK